jgi:hypothetical protein
MSHHSRVILTAAVFRRSEGFTNAVEKILALLRVKAGSEGENFEHFPVLMLCKSLTSKNLRHIFRGKYGV